MSFVDYPSFKTAVASWLVRDDLTADIPDFITLCESRLNKRLRTREMVASVTLTQNANGQVTLPSDYLEADRIVALTNPVTPLFTASPDSAAQDFSYTSSYPYRIFIQGSTMTIVPTSTANITLDYYQKLPPLATNNVNWLLTAWPDIYLYGTLMESAPRLGDDPRLATWLALYTTAIQDLEKLDARARHGKGKARVRGVMP